MTYGGETARSRRQILCAVAGTTGAVALAACGARAPAGQAGQPAAGSSSAPAEVIWTSWATDELGMNRVKEQADLFAKEFPHIKVVIANVPSREYQDKLLTGLAAGSGPDVFRDNPSRGIHLVRQGHIAELDPLFKKTPNTWWGTKDVKPGVMDWGRYRGKQYGIPMGTGAYYALHINRNLYRAAGLAEPPLRYNEPSWTFDRVLEDAKRLTKRASDGAQQFGIDRGMSWPFLHPVVMSWGGGFVNPQTGEFRWHEQPALDAIQWMADLQLKHQVAPSTAENQGGVFDFERGRLGLRWSTFNLAMYLLQTVGDQFDWDILPPPRQANRPPSIWFYVSWWMLNKASRVTDSAWTFLHWLGGPGGERVSVEYAWSAPHFYSLDEKFGLRMGPSGAKKNLNVAKDFLRYASPERPELNLGYEEAMKVLSPALSKVASGELTARQAMTQIKPQMDDLLKQGLEK